MNEKYLSKLFQSKYIIRKHDFSQKEKKNFIKNLSSKFSKSIFTPDNS